MLILFSRLRLNYIQMSGRSSPAIVDYQPRLSPLQHEHHQPILGQSDIWSNDVIKCKIRFLSRFCYILNQLGTIVIELILLNISTLFTTTKLFLRVGESNIWVMDQDRNQRRFSVTELARCYLQEPRLWSTWWTIPANILVWRLKLWRIISVMAEYWSLKSLRIHH